MSGYDFERACEHADDLSPSREPCAYCGARPTWAVVYRQGGDVWMVYLCAECDEVETEEFEDS